MSPCLKRQLYKLLKLFVLVPYLQETWDATKRPEKIDFSRENIDWLRLEITDTKKGGINGSKSVLAFKAFYR
jgi:SEC-C motif domain protein